MFQKGFGKYSMKRMNLGCGPDIKTGWTNVDSLYDPQYEDVRDYWDARETAPKYIGGDYDFILINHVLCTMKYEEAEKILTHAKEILKDGGRLQVIDMNLLKAYEAYTQNNAQAIPIMGGNIDYKLCMHVCGYGTRLSVYTPNLLITMLNNLGFRYINVLNDSPYDLRPQESLVVEAVR